MSAQQPTRVRRTTRRAVPAIIAVILLCLWSPVYGQAPSWVGDTIDSNISCPSGLRLVDMDLDGDMDVCAASYFDNCVVWYEQGADGTWQKKLISDQMPNAVGVDAGDIDGDNDIDVVAASNANHEIQWYEYDSDAGKWNSHVVDRSLREANWVKLVDIDGDGDTDILADGHGERAVVWYESRRSAPIVPITWTRRNVDDAFPGPLQLIVEDMNGDGKPDVIAASDTAQDVRLYLNLGGDPVTWRTVTIDHLLQGAVSIACGDIDGDGDVDIAAVGYSEDAVIWYENGGGECMVWKRHLVAPIGQPRHVHIDDINLDGKPDVLAASYTAHMLFWYDRVDDDMWIANEISRGLEYNRVFYTGDMNNDRRPDIVVNVQGLGSIVVLYNEVPTNIQAFPEAAARSCLLHQNHPNPFRSATSIRYTLPYSRAVTLVVTDILGREVARLHDRSWHEAGMHNVHFDGHTLPTGMYLYRLETADAVQVKSMMLLK